MIKILPDIKIENPCDDCGMFKNRDCSPTENPHCHALMTWKGVLSILSQAVEVDIDYLFAKYILRYCCDEHGWTRLANTGSPTFSQFLQDKLQEKMKK